MKYYRLLDTNHKNTILKIDGRKQFRYVFGEARWQRTGILLRYQNDSSVYYEMYESVSEKEALRFIEVKNSDLVRTRDKLMMSLERHIGEDVQGNLIGVEYSFDDIFRMARRIEVNDLEIYIVVFLTIMKGCNIQCELIEDIRKASPIILWATEALCKINAIDDYNQIIIVRSETPSNKALRLILEIFNSVGLIQYGIIENVNIFLDGK